VVEALNANGAAYVANTSLPQSKHDIGKALLKSALVLQLVVLTLFVLLAVNFHRKCRKAGILPQNLRAVLITLYISSALIGTRTIYRTIEYFTTAALKFNDTNLKISDISPIFRYEWFFWVFEGVLMAINSVMLNVWHPMRFLPRNIKIYLAMDGVTEIEGAGYEDKRSFLVTLFDPFDLYGMMKGRNMETRFWETHAEGRVNVETGRNGEAVEKRTGTSAQVPV
jgi:hypothetical protein